MGLKPLAIAAGFLAAAGVLAGALVLLGDGDGASGQEEYGYLSTRDLRDFKVRLGGSDDVKPTGEVKEFTLVAQEAEWELLPGVTAMANTFNGTVPGPTIRVTEGDPVRVTVKNELPQ